MPRCSAWRTNWTPVECDGGADAVGFVADDADRSVLRATRVRAAAMTWSRRAGRRLVQDFGALALEPRAFAGGHDGDCESCVVPFEG